MDAATFLGVDSNVGSNFGNSGVSSSGAREGVLATVDSARIAGISGHDTARLDKLNAALGARRKLLGGNEGRVVATGSVSGSEFGEENGDISKEG